MLEHKQFNVSILDGHLPALYSQAKLGHLDLDFDSPQHIGVQVCCTVSVCLFVDSSV